MVLNKNFLKEAGVSFASNEDAQAFLDLLTDELEVRVGKAISEGVDPELLKEFDQVETTEEAEAWLEKNQPSYIRIAGDTLQELLEEVKKYRGQIRGAILTVSRT